MSDRPSCDHQKLICPFSDWAVVRIGELEDEHVELITTAHNLQVDVDSMVVRIKELEGIEHREQFLTKRLAERSTELVQAQERIKELEALTAAPLPDEIARLVAKLENRAGERSYGTAGNFPRETFYEWQAAAALQAQAREIEEHWKRRTEKAEAELTKIACFIEPHWQGAGAKLEAEWIIRAIGKLNSECDELERERDAIEAATIERCAQVVEAMPIQIYRGGPTAAERSCKPATFDDAAEAIRALKPPEKEGN